VAKIEERGDLAKNSSCCFPKKATAAIPRGPSKQSPQHALHSHLLKLLTELRFNKKKTRSERKREDKNSKLIHRERVVVRQQ